MLGVLRHQYGVALDNLVKGCTDILLLNPDGTHIFAGKRCVQREFTFDTYVVIIMELFVLRHF